MIKEKLFTLDESHIKALLTEGTPLEALTATASHEAELNIQAAISEILAAAQRSELKDYIAYCVQELVGNAKKANIKRVYFAEKQLSFTDPTSYTRGMLTFKNDIMNNLDHYLTALAEQDYYIKVKIECRDNALVIEVRNNSVISNQEIMRIRDKLGRSRQYRSMEDAFQTVLDDTEGAGLGIVVMVLMLRKIGLDERCYTISKTPQETITRLSVPLSDTKVTATAKLTDEIVTRIDYLPRFPDNIRQVQQLAANPRTELSEIARAISMDVAMTADLLKLVNTARYMQIKRVESILDAVKILGITGIKNLLYSYGAQKILGDDTEEKKALWEHSYKTAYYAYNMVKNLRKDLVPLIDDIYVGGLLHDMGRIVLLQTNAEFMQGIYQFCAAHDIPKDTLEDIAAGVNHGEIGALVAAKWNFPDSLQAMLRYHHAPLDAPPQFRSLVDAVYLADRLTHYDERIIGMKDIDSGILAGFSITKEEQLNVIVRRMNEGLRGASR